MSATTALIIRRIRTPTRVRPELSGDDMSCQLVAFVQLSYGFYRRRRAKMKDGRIRYRVVPQSNRRSRGTEHRWKVLPSRIYAHFRGQTRMARSGWQVDLGEGRSPGISELPWESEPCAVGASSPKPRAWLRRLFGGSSAGKDDECSSGLRCGRSSGSLEELWAGRRFPSGCAFDVSVDMQTSSAAETFSPST